MGCEALMGRSVARHRGSDTDSVLFVGTPPIDIHNVCETVFSRPVDIDIVTDGREAISQLTEISDSTAVGTVPTLIIIQFGFGSPDGMTVVQAIKSSPRLGSVPVIALTPDQRDAEAVYECGGNAHVTVPRSTNAYAECVESISQFWVEWTRNPAAP